jgi:hypothetical protein
MKTKEFLANLPTQFNNWGTENVTPKDSRFADLLKRVNGMTTQNILALLNLSVRYLEKDEVYLEVGTYQGAMICGAMLDAPNLPLNPKGIAIDNFSEFDHGNNQELFIENANREGLERNIYLINHDFRDYFNSNMFEYPAKIGVYVYDGAHDYSSQLKGLELAIPYLADDALIIVDDTNELECKSANEYFLENYPNCQKVLDFPTVGNGHYTWWNGIQVFTWRKLYEE